MEEKSLLLQKENKVKMKYGSNLLRKHGQKCVEVTKPQKWVDVVNSLKIMMEHRPKYIGQKIMKQIEVKNN